MKKFVLIFAFMIFLSGCVANNVKIKMNEKTYEEEGYKISVEVPEISGNSEFIDKFNEDYEKFCNNEIEAFIEEARKSAAPEDSLTLKQDIKLNKNGVVSIVGEWYAYTGGPHGAKSRIVKNADILLGKELVLKDLFSDGEYINRLNSYISTLMEQKPEEFLDLWKTPTVTEEQEFYLTDKGIVLFYPPYELSYYAKGFVEIEIPYREVDSYLNPEYKGRIW